MYFIRWNFSWKHWKNKPFSFISVIKEKIYMKAVVIKEYGAPSVLQKSDEPIPEINRGEVLVKVYSSAINPVDYKIRNGSIKFLTGSKFPKILGGDIAGTVEKASDKSRFKPGDKVYGMLTFKGGGYAEFASISENSLAPVPATLGFGDAAAIPLAGLTAFQSLVYKGKIEKGSKVLIIGASGGVGHFGVQIAKAYGATVTAVCSGRNTDFVKSLGADEILNYEEDSVESLQQKYDIVFDAVAAGSFSKYRKLISVKGVYINTLPGPAILLRQSFNFLFSKKAYAIMTRPDGKDLEILSVLVEQGKMKPFIERTYTMDQIQEAHNRIESNRVKGKLVLQILS